MINLAFASNDAIKNEREKVLFESIKSFKQDLSSEMEWAQLGESAMTDSLERLSEILSQKHGRRANSTDEPTKTTDPAQHAPPAST